MPFIVFCSAYSPALAQINVEFDSSKRHHVSAVVGGAHLYKENETAVTLGLDYEYRVSRLLGLGFVAERAFGEIDATTILAVADIHLWRGLAIQAGPGVEISDDETHAAGRVGALYEFEVAERYTVSPQVHFDISEENAVIFAIAFGRSF